MQILSISDCTGDVIFEDPKSCIHSILYWDNMTELQDFLEWAKSKLDRDQSKQHIVYSTAD